MHAKLVETICMRHHMSHRNRLYARTEQKLHQEICRRLDSKAKLRKGSSKSCLNVGYGGEAGAVGGCPVPYPQGAVPVCPCDAAAHLAQQGRGCCGMPLLLRV